MPGGTVFGAEPGHGLSQNAVKIEHWGGFITNSMVVSWVVAIILIICQSRDAEHEGYSRRGSEPPGMAGRKSVRLFGENHWAAPGQADVLVSGDDLHFHFVGKLVWPHSRSWHDWVGTADFAGLRDWLLSFSFVGSSGRCRKWARSGRGSAQRKTRRRRSGLHQRLVGSFLGPVARKAPAPQMKCPLDQCEQAIARADSFERIQE